MKQFTIYADDDVPVREMSDTVYSTVISVGGTAESVTVPAGARIVFFKATADFYVKTSGTAAVPSGDVLDGSASLLNPESLYVERVSTLSLVSSSGGAIINMEFFA